MRAGPSPNYELWPKLGKKASNIVVHGMGWRRVVEGEYDIITRGRLEAENASDPVLTDEEWEKHMT